MRFFWDTTAVINASVSPDVAARLSAGEHYVCVHLFAEFFSVMTGRGISGWDADGHPVRVTLDPDDATRWLCEFASRVQTVELDGSELLEGLKRARQRNVFGARVYDYVHALAAIKCGAEVLLTRNPKHFEGLAGAARLEWP